MLVCDFKSHTTRNYIAYQATEQDNPKNTGETHLYLGCIAQRLPQRDEALKLGVPCVL